MNLIFKAALPQTVRRDALIIEGSGTFFFRGPRFLPYSYNSRDIRVSTLTDRIRQFSHINPTGLFDVGRTEHKSWWRRT